MDRVGTAYVEQMVRVYRQYQKYKGELDGVRTVMMANIASEVNKQWLEGL